MQDQIDSSSTPRAPGALDTGPLVPEPIMPETLVPERLTPEEVAQKSWSCRVEQALGLISPSRWTVVQRIAILVAIVWLPLMLITAFTNPAGLSSLLADGRVFVRTLICIPALLIGEFLIAYQMTEASNYLRQGNFLDDADLSYMESLSVSIARLANAAIPQLVVFVLIIVRVVAAFRTVDDMAPWIGQGIGATGLHLTLAGWYAICVSMPIWFFLLGMTVWGWLLWVYFVFELSRRKLNLIASHPDKQGGLGFLGLSASGFAPIAFALCFSIAANWRHAIVHQGAHLSDFKFHAIVLAACIAAIAVGPLIFFVPRLTELRRSGILDYGVLGQVHSTRYHQAWIRMRTQQDTKTLLAPENNTLLNFGKTYDNVGAVQIFPATKSSFYPLVVAVIIPGVYVATAQLPIVVILKDLLHALK